MFVRFRVSGVELVADGDAGGERGIVGCCRTSTTCAVLPCKNAWSRGSPETVKIDVELQLGSKTGALLVTAVGVVVVFGARFLADAGAGVAFTGVLLLLVFVLVAKARREGGTVVRQPPPCCAIQLRHPPSRSGTYFSPRLGAQSEQLQYPLQAGHANVSAKRSNVNRGYLGDRISQECV